MECDKCHRERQHGRMYRFYYGNKGQPTTSLKWGAVKMTRTPYRVAGQATAWICRRCLFMRYGLLVGLAVGMTLVIGCFFLFLGLGLSIQKPSSPQAGLAVGLMAPGLGFLILGGAVLVIAFRRRTNLGERLAIDLEREALKLQGYDIFLTTEQYNKLDRDNSLSS